MSGIGRTAARGGGSATGAEIPRGGAGTARGGTRGGSRGKFKKKDFKLLFKIITCRWH
jgi:hypothetical protein